MIQKGGFQCSLFCQLAFLKKETHLVSLRPENKQELHAAVWVLRHFSSLLRWVQGRDGMGEKTDRKTLLLTPQQTINLDNLKIKKKKGKRQHFSSKVLNKKYIV